jgi:hypothetical protein
MSQVARWSVAYINGNCGVARSGNAAIQAVLSQLLVPQQVLLDRRLT